MNETPYLYFFPLTLHTALLVILLLSALFAVIFGFILFYHWREYNIATPKMSTITPLIYMLGSSLLLVYMMLQVIRLSS